MLDKDNDEARQFLFTYFKPSDKNSIEQYEDDFIAQFQLIHDEIEQANEKLCETYEDILLAYDQATPHKCVDCKENYACIAFEECGHVLFCEACSKKIEDEDSSVVKITCPVCKICYNTNTYIRDGTKKPKFRNLKQLFEGTPQPQKKTDGSV